MTVTVDSAGELEVFVGGEVEPDSTTAAGTYRGIMVLRTHYTGI